MVDLVPEINGSIGTILRSLRPANPETAHGIGIIKTYQFEFAGDQI